MVTVTKSGTPAASQETDGQMHVLDAYPKYNYYDDTLYETCTWWMDIAPGTELSCAGYFDTTFLEPADFYRWVSSTYRATT